MHNPTRHLCQLKALAISLTLNPKWERHLPSFDISLWVIYKVPPKSKYQSWYLNPCCGLEVHNLTQELKSVKDLDNTFDLNSKWERTVPSFDIFLWVMYRVPPPKSKYQSWYLTPCCGLEVHSPTQALKSVKGLGNTFDLSSKWERTLPSFDLFLWVIYKAPPKKNSNVKVDMWHPAVGLRCIVPPRHLCQLKALTIPLI